MKKKEKPYVRPDYVTIKDKGGKTSVYDVYGRGLKIFNFTVTEDGNYYGFIDGWEYSIVKHGQVSTVRGKTQEELLDFIKTLSKLKKVISKNKKEITLIYTDSLKKIEGFCQKYITQNDNKNYIQLCDTIEFRDITKWSDKFDTSEEIALFAQQLINEAFVPEHYYYLTANQRVRKMLQKILKDNNMAPDMMPDHWDEYIRERNALFSGMLFDSLEDWTYENKAGTYIHYFDLTSAYPYVLCCKMHPMEKPLLVSDPENYASYAKDGFFTIGLYEITYTSSSNKLNTFKLEHHNEHPITTQIWLCNYDLETISKLCDSLSVTCLILKVAQQGYLPKEIIDEVINQFNKKQSLKGQGAKYDIQKKVVNGITGDLSLKPWDNRLNKHLLKDVNEYRDLYRKKYKKFKSKVIYSIYWGISVLAQTRAIITSIALQTNAIYGDTDGLFLYGYKDNLDLINYYNDKVREEVAALGYKVEGPLGQFKLECVCDKFKAFGLKTYIYKPINEELVTKIAGMAKAFSSKIGEEAFDWDYNLKYGSAIVRATSDKHIEYKDYESDGYYYEYYADLNDAVELLKISLILATGGEIKEK